MDEKMKAVFLHGPHDLRVEETGKPKITPNQALIKIDSCGICPTDVRGYALEKDSDRAPPYIPGHEWVGSVIQVGNDLLDFHEGDRVAAEWRAPCGKCYYCRKGIFNYCGNLDKESTRGGFCEYGYASGTNMRLVPRNVSYEEACFTEPVACCINGIKKCAIQIGDDVVIIGAGPIGLIHLQLAKHLGARVIQCDLMEERLVIARSLGADDIVVSSEEDTLTKVRELTHGRGAAAVIVAVGGQKPVEQAIEMTGLGGTINVFAGTYPPARISLDPNLIHYRQISITGSHDFTPYEFTTALRMLSLRTLLVRPLISHVFPLEKTKEGFDTVAKRKGLKVIIKIA